MKENRYAILYTDGGSRPNPGKVGSGVHGYIFDKSAEKQLCKMKGMWLTNVGYVDAVTAKQRGMDEVYPFAFIDGAYSYKERGTNNMGEIMAIVNSFNDIMNTDLEVHKFFVMTDSKVAISTFKALGSKKRSDFMKRSATKKYVLEAVCDVIDKMKAGGRLFKLEWVKGHSNLHGNEMADTYATIGIFSGTSTFKISDAKGYFNPKDERNRLVDAKFVFGLTHLQTIPGTYRFINVKKDKTIGRLDPDRLSYGIYYGKAIPLVDNIIKILDGKQRTVVPYVVRIRNIFDKRNLRTLQLFGTECLGHQETSSGSILKVGALTANQEHDKDTAIVGNLIKPVGLTNEAKELFELIETCENTRHLPNPLFTEIDITDLLYTKVVGKGKKEVRRIPIGTEFIKLKLKNDWSKKGMLKLTLYLGRCLPTVNQMNTNKPQQDFSVKLCILFDDLKADYICRTEIGDEKLYTAVSGNLLYKEI